MLERLGHKAGIAFLLLSGLLMAIAMIPLIILIVAGMLLFSLTTRHTPRELTRRTALGSSRSAGA